MTKPLALCFAPLLALLLASGPRAWAFPGLIRDGYVNCTACHVSPNGAGVLTPYGRELAQELLSHSSKEGEGAFLYGAFADKIPEMLNLGGDIRTIATHKDNPVFREDRLFLMQADLEAAANLGKFTLDASFGYYDGGYAKSLRHYLMYHRTDENTFRFGRFMPAFGINTTEHTLTTRGNLGFDEGMETYNLEAAWLKEKGSLYLTAILGRPEGLSYRDGLSFGTENTFEHGAAARGSVYLADHYELGASYYYGVKDTSRRHVVGPFAVLGITPRLFVLSELDFQFQTPTGGSTASGVFSAERVDVEPWQGIHFIAYQESARPDFSDARALTSRFGIGSTIYPRPHWEIDLRWYRQKASPDVSRFSDFAWLLAHFYL